MTAEEIAEYIISDLFSRDGEAGNMIIILQDDGVHSMNLGGWTKDSARKMILGYLVKLTT